MKSQSNNIRSHMVRGARINYPIWSGTRIEVTDYSMSIGCSEGLRQSLGRSKRERSKSRGREMTALLTRVSDYTTNLTTPKVAVVLELGRWS